MKPFAVAAAGRTLKLGERPWLMGIVNASRTRSRMPASTGTSTGGCSAPGSCSARAADIIDVGGESAITRRPPVDADVEIARVDGLALQEALRHAR